MTLMREGAYDAEQQSFGVQVWRGYQAERPWRWRTILHGQVRHTALTDECCATAEEAFTLGMRSLLAYLHDRAETARKEAELVALTCVVGATEHERWAPPVTPVSVPISRGGS